MRAGAALKLDPPPDPDGRTPETFLAEIQRIINSGTLRGAREVAEQGLVLFPDHLKLRQAHYALRPLKTQTIPYTYSDPQPSYDWLKKNAAAYRGKWVGLDNGELVAASKSYQAVREALRDRDPRGTLIHFID